MEAMISGRTGVALVVDGDNLASIHASDPERMVPRQTCELRFLIGEGRDFVPLENTSRERVVQELLLERSKEEALLLALVLLDSDRSQALKRQAAGELEDLLNRNGVGPGVENVLYAEPLPPEADLKGGLAAAKGQGRVLALLDRLSVRQKEIREVRLAWAAIRPKKFGGEPKMWQSVAVREGLFRRLVLQIAGGRNVHELLVEASGRPSVRALPNHLGVLQEWFLPFTQRYSVVREPELADGRQASLVAESTAERRLSISYSHEDSDFVGVLEPLLDGMGVRFWRDVHDMRAGRIESQIDRGMALHSVVLLILSRSSVSSDWIEAEVTQTRELERQYRDQGTPRDLLIPIALDDSWKRSDWPRWLRRQVEERNVLDFSRWKAPAVLKEQFWKLFEGIVLRIQALRR